MEFFVLKSYDYSDISNIKGGSAIINDLKFEYQKRNHNGYIELGDIPFEYYYDCGDICVDITNIKFQSFCISTIIALCRYVSIVGMNILNLERKKIIHELYKRYYK